MTLLIVPQIYANKRLQSADADQVPIHLQVAANARGTLSGSSAHSARCMLACACMCRQPVWLFTICLGPVDVLHTGNGSCGNNYGAAMKQLQ
jgi:hypothetical protein